jgi:hypothetical protein
MPRLLLAIALVAALAPATAEARPKKVALVALEISGDGAPELRPQLAESIAAGLARADVATVELDTVQEALAPSPELIGCFSSTCLERIGERVGADGFVRGRVGADGADYNVELELYDRGRLVHRLELPCAVCTIGELNQLALELSTRLVAEASDAPVQVVVRTEPAGAELTIDGLARGPEPFEGTLPRGPHFVVAEIKGVGVVKRRIEVTEASGAEPIVISFPGASSGLSADAAHPGMRSLGTVKWITGGVAVAALGLGATLLVLDGRESCNGNGRTCPEIYDTALPGWVAIGVGGAAAVAAGWMFYADRPARRQIAVTPTPGGAAAVWRGEF